MDFAYLNLGNSLFFQEGNQVFHALRSSLLNMLYTAIYICHNRLWVNQIDRSTGAYVPH